MVSAQKGFDQGRATVFTEGYCAHADMAYRFCYVLLLNPLAAKQSVQSAFREIANELVGVIPNADSLSVVLGRCFKSAEKQKASQADAATNPLVGLLGTMSQEERALLFLMDVAGRTLAEASGVLGVKEDRSKKSLAAARRKMMSHAFSQIELPKTSSEELDSEP